MAVKQQFVEFYFPGLNTAGQNERKVDSRDTSILENIPEHAISFRFFEKDENNNKVNYSFLYYLGKEYTNEDFKKKYPQSASEPEYSNASRIVQLRNNGGFRALGEKDIVIA